MTTTLDWDALRAAALAVSLRAHAPYSKFQVGAALLCDDGRVFAGCNVENASFGLTICAERSALFAAVAAGAQRFVALALISSAQKPVTPCGACRQVLSEFPPSFAIRCYGQDGSALDTDGAALLPYAFAGNDFREP
jgi:cytidine deaminase